MDIKGRLAVSLGVRDEGPNVALAEELAKSGTPAQVKDLVSLLSDKDKNVQSDSVKVLYELAERKPELVKDHADVLINLLASKNNRMVWGAMTGLNHICLLAPEKINAALPEIIIAADKGSVIVKDHAIGILIKLAADKKYSANAIPLLLEQLRLCATNQLPMYAEYALPKSAGYGSDLKSVLSHRLDEIEKESKRRRVEKVIKKL